MTAMIHDDTNCLLGEGPMWHPERGELFWFDIIARKLHTKARHWTFDTNASAAGWVDRDTLLIATAKDFRLLHLESGKSETVAPLEAENPGTRSNDGRVDPHGGFWIGTMGLAAEVGAGAIYRFYKGELRTIYPNIHIPNSICFSPDGLYAYWTDTETQLIHRQPLDAEGWPKGETSIHIDLRDTTYWPDGSVMDAAGNLWNAQWGSSRVAGYGPDGAFLTAFDVPASQSSCPAFGGADMTTLFCTSAAAGLPQAHLVTHPASGQTFAHATTFKGQPEYRVLL
jgi:sugar lactone lactonase YvrE